MAAVKVTCSPEQMLVLAVDIAMLGTITGVHFTVVAVIPVMLVGLSVCEVGPLVKVVVW